MAIWRLAQASYGIHRLAKDLDERAVSKTACRIPRTTPLKERRWPILTTCWTSLSKVCYKLLDPNCAGTGVTLRLRCGQQSANLQLSEHGANPERVLDQQNRLKQTCAATSAPACSAGTKLSELESSSLII